MNVSPARWLCFLSVLGASSLALMPESAAARPVKTAFPTEHKLVQGNGSTVDNVRGKGTPRALLNMRIDYTDKWDTDVRDIGFDLVDGWLFRPWLGDANAESPFTARGTWRDMSKSETVEYVHLTANCRQKTCDLGAAVRTNGKVPLLSGFSFHNLSGAAQIERMAVYPKTKGGWITYEARYEAPGRTNYVVDLFVVLVDPKVVDDSYSAEADSRDGEHFARVPLKWKKTGLLALQGFDVRFRNGAHQLQEFAIESLRGTNAEMGVYFSDKNDDDPVSAKLWWADLKAPGVKMIPFDKPLPQHKPTPGGTAPQINPKHKPATKGGKKSPKTFPTLPGGKPTLPKGKAGKGGVPTFPK